MSITAETAKAHAHDPAVLCCRAEAGITIEPANLEDPAIFDDLVDSGLLNLDGCLTIEEVLGAKLTKTCDSLCPLTNDVLDGVKAPTTPAEEKAEEEAPAEEAAPAAPVASAATVAGGTLKIHIGEGKDINLEIPVGALGATGEAVAEVPAAAVAATATAEAPVEEAKVVGTLTRRHIKITEVKRGPETKIEGTTLYIREGIEAEVIADQELVKDFHLEIITPDKYHTYSETIMDVQPVATKEGDAILGEGATRVLDGVVMMLTGTDEGGVQIGEFGSSEGYLDENIMWGRPGCPDKGEIFIKGNIVVQEKTNMERRGPMAAHTAFDIITQEIREVMKELDDSFIVEDEELKSIRRPGKKKVVIVKEIMGQGAMHDNFILPVEPVGILGARANVDLGNVPVCVSPLEVLDGCIHALTCIGPASKEMSRHYWRDPLVLEALHDEEVDLCGVVFVGSPQINAEKYYVSRRVGHTVPGKTLIEISKILSGEAENVVSISYTKNHIVFEFDNTIVVSRLIEGEYFRIDQMLSSDYETKVRINKKELLSCIDRATLLVKEGDKKPIIINIGDELMELKIKSQIGSMNEEIMITKEGKDLLIGFNPKFLIDALRVIDDEEVTIYLMNAKAPCFIKDDAESYVYLILPVNFNSAA